MKTNLMKTNLRLVYQGNRYGNIVPLLFSALLLQLSAEVSAAPPIPLPDTTKGIHVGQMANYYVTDPASEVGVVDFVWGSDHPTQPTGVYNTGYFPFEREPGPHPHDLNWFLTNHPDWIEYDNDRVTPAYQDNDCCVPLDISNPEVLDYLFQTYYAPAIEIRGYQGIAFDNVTLINYARHGGVWKNRVWVQQYNGTNDDPVYRTDVLNWAKYMSSHLHAINATVTMNFTYTYYDSSLASDSAQLLQYLDVDLDEGGFTKWGAAYPDYLSGDQWLTYMKAMQSLETQGKGYVAVNQYPDTTFNNLSKAQKQWALANYLLIKGSHHYLYISGNQEYGKLLIAPEYSANIGAPTNAIYPSQNVYMRDYDNGRAIVNPSVSTSYNVSLPAGTYKDLYGNSVNSVTLPPVSGMVLVGR